MSCLQQPESYAHVAKEHRIHRKGHTDDVTPEKVCKQPDMGRAILKAPVQQWRILFATFNFPFRLVHTGAEAEGVTKLGRVLMRA